jgi:hypothetical protein
MPLRAHRHVVRANLAIWLPDPSGGGRLMSFESWTCRLVSAAEEQDARPERDEYQVQHHRWPHGRRREVEPADGLPRQRLKHIHRHELVDREDDDVIGDALIGKSVRYRRRGRQAIHPFTYGLGFDRRDRSHAPWTDDRDDVAGRDWETAAEEASRRAPGDLDVATTATCPPSGSAREPNARLFSMLVQPLRVRTPTIRRSRFISRSTVVRRASLGDAGGMPCRALEVHDDTLACWCP